MLFYGCWLLIDGGTLVLPEAQTTQVISTPWIFQMTSGTLAGDVSVENGGAIGTHNLRVLNTNAVPRCAFRITGKLDVDAASYIWAQGGGFFTDNGNPFKAAIRGSHGGQNACD